MIISGALEKQRNLGVKLLLVPLELPYDFEDPPSDVQAGRC